MRVNLNSDEATSTAIPLAGVSRNSRTSRLYQYCLLARNQMPTHFARGRRGYPRQCLAQHAGLRVNNELGLRPQYSLPSSRVLDCGLTLTRTVLEAAHHCPRSTTSLPSSNTSALKLCEIMKLNGYKQPDKHLYKWLDAHFAGHTFVRKIRPRNVRTWLGIKPRVLLERCNACGASCIPQVLVDVVG